MSKPNIEMKAMGALLSNVDFTEVPVTTIDWINQHPKDAGAQLTRWLKNGCQLIVGEIKKLFIDRSKPFDLKKFMGDGWKIDEQDKRSLELNEVDLTKVPFAGMFDKKGESYVGREERLKRLAKAGQIPFDAMVFQTLWENQSLIPDSWKEKINGKKREIYFDGTVFLDGPSRRFVLFLFCEDGSQWDYGVSQCI